MGKSKHIFKLERRFLAIENEISETLLNYSTDDPMIGDLKRRLLHLPDELNRLHPKTFDIKNSIETNRLLLI